METIHKWGLKSGHFLSNEGPGFSMNVTPEDLRDSDPDTSITLTNNKNMFGEKVLNNVTYIVTKVQRCKVQRSEFKVKVTLLETIQCDYVIVASILHSQNYCRTDHFQ